MRYRGYFTQGHLESEWQTESGQASLCSHLCHLWAFSQGYQVRWARSHLRFFSWIFPYPAIWDYNLPEERFNV